MAFLTEPEFRALEIAASMRVPASGPSEVVPPAIEHLVVVPGLVHVLAKTVVVASPEGALGTRMTWTPTTRRALAETEAAFEPLPLKVTRSMPARGEAGDVVNDAVGSEEEVTVTVFGELCAARPRWSVTVRTAL